MPQGEPMRKRSGSSKSAGNKSAGNKSAGSKSGGGSGSGSGAGASRHEIPDKLYFRIGEVAKLCEVPAYVLRFWESEFPHLKPNKGGTGQRLYRRRDVEMALRIKTLLYDEGYTIPGARQAFKAELRAGRDPQAATESTSGTGADLKPLEALRKELQDLHALLSSAPAGKAPARPALQAAGRPVQPVQAIRPPRPVEPVAEKPAPPPPMQFPARPQLLKARPVPAESAGGSLFDFLPPDA